MQGYYNSMPLPWVIREYKISPVDMNIVSTDTMTPVNPICVGEHPHPPD